MNDSLSPDKAGQIEVWARRYARNRTLALVIAWTFATGGTLSLYPSMRWVSQTWGAPDGLATAASIAASLLCWWCFLRFGRFHTEAVLQDLAQRVYGHEGRLPLDPPREGRLQMRVGVYVFIGIGLIAASEVLLRWIPAQRIQPVSALCIVPFALLVGRTGGGPGTPMVWLWPALYGLHAVFVVLVEPVQFAGERAPLNVALPFAIYGVVAALAAYLYSRYALTRLKEAVR